MIMISDLYSMPDTSLSGVGVSWTASMYSLTDSSQPASRSRLADVFEGGGVSESNAGDRNDDVIDSGVFSHILETFWEADWETEQ